MTMARCCRLNFRSRSTGEGRPPQLAVSFILCRGRIDLQHRLHVLRVTADHQHAQRAGRDDGVLTGLVVTG